MKKSLCLLMATLSLLTVTGCVVVPARPAPAYYAAPVYPTASVYVGGGGYHRW